jgi:pimeloyl-ACP methyl ester carboxylesterase
VPIAEIDNTRLYYEDQGSGAPLFLIHGLGSSAQDWENQVAHFAKSFRVIAPDLRGHGRSDKPAGGYSIRRFADDIAGLMSTLRTGPAHVVGLSLGGGVAFQLALDAPQLLRTLTIVNSAPEMILRTWQQKFAIGSRRVIVRMLGLPGFGRMLSKKLFPSPEHGAQRNTFEERFARNDPQAYTASLNALIGWSVSARLGEIRCPTLVITADQDYTPVAFKEAYVAQIPNAHLAVVPDSRHALPMERPEAFNRVLMDFLVSKG